MALPIHEKREAKHYEMARRVVEGLYGKAGFGPDALVSLVAERERCLLLEERIARHELMSMQDAYRILGLPRAASSSI